MPLVEVVYNPDLVGQTTRQKMKPQLKEAIAAELDCSSTEENGEGGLTPDEIVVRFRPVGEDDDKPLDLDILVNAKWYATRAVDVQERTDRILQRIGGGVVLSTGIFVTLPVAGWSEGRP